MKYRCLMFGHKWIFNSATDIRPYCKKCYEENYYLDNLYKKQTHDIKMEQMQHEFDEQHGRVKKRLKF